MLPLELNAFDDWLWNLTEEDLRELRLPTLQRAAVQAGVDLPQLTVLTVISDAEDPLQLFTSRATGVQAVKTSGHVGLIAAHLAGRDHVVAVWPAGDHVFHIASTPPLTDDAWKRVEEGWMNAAAPDLAPVILNRAEFEAIGDVLAEHGSIEVARMTARVLRDHSSYTRGWPSIPGQARPTHQDALRETESMIVRTITLDVAGVMRLQVRRSSGASFYSGSFHAFSSIVLQRLANAAKERRVMLADRDRAPREPVREVLSMSIDTLNLDDPTVRELLFETVAHVKGLQVATLHDNPYLHLLVTDFLNGTNFDVLVTDSHAVEIIPGLESSVGSLARVTDALGDALGMKDLQLLNVEEKISVEEFFGA